MRTRGARAESLRVRLEAPERECERLIAELWSLGTAGVEERAPAGAATHSELHAYFAAAGAPLAELEALARAIPGVRILEIAPVPDQDWEVAWRAGLAPRRIGGLWVRPSFCAPVGSPELVIDPQQAFGSGEHASTRLSLELVQEELRADDSLLDLGTGSGILGLGALRRGTRRALGIDSDPIAIANASENRARNGLPLLLACATLEALAPRARFDVVVANLLLHELLPCLDDLAARARRVLIVSGYLERERAALDRALAATGLELARESSEIQSGDRWCARVLHQAAAPSR
ncbi:MAG TPA: 50S ribosomal protein L11 methyltransferase [Myxococcota bacterium]|nr:50S ribosomal protein L11 methyltransferase [Myxococcota bacterium]